MFTEWIKNKWSQNQSQPPFTEIVPNRPSLVFDFLEPVNSFGLRFLPQQKSMEECLGRRRARMDSAVSWRVTDRRIHSVSRVDTLKTLRKRGDIKLHWVNKRQDYYGHHSFSELGWP